MKFRNEESPALPVTSPQETKEFDIIEVIAKELIEAIHSKNAAAVAETLRAAFTLLDK